MNIARYYATIILKKVLNDKRHLNYLMQDYIHRIGDGRDKRFLTELILGTLRWLGGLDRVLRQYLNRSFDDLNPFVLNNLRRAVYEYFFLKKPSYAVVNEAVEVIKKMKFFDEIALTNAVLRKIIENSESIRFEPLRDTLNEYLLNKWLKNFGKEKTSRIIEHFLKPAPLYIWKTRRISSEEFESLLKKEGIDFERVPFLRDCYKLSRYPRNIDRVYFRIQDLSTQIISDIFLRLPGDGVVLDPFCGTGGKTLYNINFSPNFNLWVCSELKHKRLRRFCNFLNLLFSPYDICSRVLILKGDFRFIDFKCSFDKILLDVPCSGTGTFRRKPDLKWKLSFEYIKKISQFQLEALRKAFKYLKKGGYILYTTCTLEKEENEEVVENFLKIESNTALVSPLEFLNGAYGIFNKFIFDGKFIKINFLHLDCDYSFGAIIKKT